MQGNFVKLTNQIKDMKHLNLFGCCFFLFLLMDIVPAQAQSKQMTVKGQVKDGTFNDPLPGANVFIKGTTEGTVTDIDGKYSLVVPADGNTVLVFSYIGCVTQEISVGSRGVINVVMQDESQSLDDVVVIAYGTQSKLSVTSALSTMDNKDLVKSPVASITNSIAGSIPGVTAVQTSGQPGNDDATLYIRGSGSLDNSLAKPLVLVDGIEREFSQIDANEIESISVLKDASATAVFGVRGANGVILVTTRRGDVGKPKISISSSVGLQQPISLVEQTGSYEFAKFWNIKQKLDGITDARRYFTPEQIEAYRTGSDPIMYPNVDWMDYLFRDVFVQSKNNVNISGGSENVRYFVSVGYLYQNGLLKQLPGQPYDNNYRYDRYNYRANIDAKLSPTTTLKFGVGGNLGVSREPRNVVSGTASNAWVIAQIWSLPFAGPGFVDGVRTLVPKGFVPTTEVMRDGMFVFYGMGYNQNYRTTLNMDIDITQNLDFVTDGLSVSVKGAYDNVFNLNKTRAGGSVEYQEVRYKSYFDTNGTMPETDPYYDKTYVFTPVGSNTPLSYAESYGRDQNWYVEARLNYDRTFAGHKVTGLLLYNQSRNYYPATYVYIPRSYIGLVGRVGWSFRNRYMADFSIGYNGSENFAPGKTRFGLFPSFSAGWVISGENFMKKQNVVSFLKIRASWGLVGNDQGVNSRFMYMPERWSSSGGYSFGVNNPVNSESYAISVYGNPEVTWETASKWNVGLESTFFQDRLTFNLDLFHEYRSGILIAPQSIPDIAAISSPNLNLGKVSNKGYEVVLGWKDRIGKNFSYSIDANVSYARNKIIFMDEIPNEYDYMNQTGGSTGRNTNLYKFIRLYQYSDFTVGEDGSLVLNPDLPQPQSPVYPGDAMYADLNGDNIVDGDDRFVTGYSTRPEYFFGINIGASWKNLSLTMQWTGAAHVDKMLDLEYRIPFTNSGNRGLLSYFYDGCWTPDNQQGAIYPRPAETSESWNSEASTLWLQDASYLRLKNLSLTYTFSGYDVFKKLGINSLGLTFSGYNLLTFTGLKYIDPEGITDNNGSYPLVRLYSFGLNINF